MVNRPWHWQMTGTAWKHPCAGFSPRRSLMTAHKSGEIKGAAVGVGKYEIGIYSVFRVAESDAAKLTGVQRKGRCQ